MQLCAEFYTETKRL